MCSEGMVRDVAIYQNHLQPRRRCKLLPLGPIRMTTSTGTSQWGSRQGWHRILIVVLTSLMLMGLTACSGLEIGSPASGSEAEASGMKPTAVRANKPTDSRKARTPGTPLGAEHEVLYRISGTVPNANIIYVAYEREQGHSRQARVKLSWTKSFTARDGEYLYVSAQSAGKLGSVKCEIFVNGGRVGRTQVDGPAEVASCDHLLKSR